MIFDDDDHHHHHHQSCLSFSLSLMWVCVVYILRRKEERMEKGREEKRDVLK
jgi:hypothetical protein